MININKKLILESIIMGIATLIIGQIIFELTLEKNNNKKQKKPFGFSFSFFITGAILHFIIEIIGLNKLYC